MMVQDCAHKLVSVVIVQLPDELWQIFVGHGQHLILLGKKRLQVEGTRQRGIILSLLIDLFHCERRQMTYLYFIEIDIQQRSRNLLINAYIKILVKVLKYRDHLFRAPFQRSLARAFHDSVVGMQAVHQLKQLHIAECDLHHIIAADRQRLNFAV